MRFNLYNKEVPDHLSQGNREWIAESSTGKENVLITIGDSWTWGDSLGTSATTENNKKYRYENFYTSLLASKLDADWLMLAWCGTNNRWIVSRYLEVCGAIKQGFYKGFKKIYVHVNFTEMFRDIESFADIHEDSFNSVNDFAKYYFKKTVVDKTKKTNMYTKYHTFGQNFWNFDFEKDQRWMTDVWQDLLFKYQDIEYRVITPMVSGIATQPFISYCRRNSLKSLLEDFKNRTHDMLELASLLEKSELNSIHGTKHPNELGHKIWADYLYKYYSNL